MLRATSEATLRGQAELAAVALQARAAALEADCAALRAANQELLRAKSAAEEQRDTSAARWVLCRTAAVVPAAAYTLAHISWLVQGPCLVTYICVCNTSCFRCSVETEVAALRAQLEREQAVAAERQANHADAMAQLEGSRWAIAAVCCLLGGSMIPQGRGWAVGYQADNYLLIWHVIG